MNKKEYMEQLSRALECVDSDTARDIMEDYEAHFERAAESGRSEQEVIGELGSIEEFVEELRQFTTGRETPHESRGNAVREGCTALNHGGADGAPVKAGSGEHKAAEAGRDQNAGCAENGNGSTSNSAPGQNDSAEQNKMEKIGDSIDRKFNRFGDSVDKKLDPIGEAIDRKFDGFGDSVDKKFNRFGDSVDEKFDRFGDAVDDKFDRIGEIVNSAVSAATSHLKQVPGYLDKVFSNMGDWFGSCEKSGESEKDYRRRQEDAKYDRKSRQERACGEREYVHTEGSYHYSADSGEEYMDECSGMLTQADRIRHITVDSKAADVVIRKAEDGIFRYSYQNDGSAGSKIVYRLEKRISQDTIHLSIGRDEQVQKKNHFTILGGIFDENADIQLELRLPEWMETLSVCGKSGDISMQSCQIRTLQLKTTSGDIRIVDSSAEKCMLETMSGDAEARNGNFDYLLAASKSGDARIFCVRAEKAACRSMSGDAVATDCSLGEAVVASMSGDARVTSCKGGTVSVESVSGDARIDKISMRNIKLSSTSGDANASGADAEKFIVKTVSGDVDAKEVRSVMLKASSTSGDISLRGSSEDMTLANGSGDIIVVQEGNTRAAVTTRSGDVSFHLKNEGEGFAARVSTHGDISFRYGNLKLNEAGNGLHRYGAEGSGLNISLTSGDITVTD